VLDKYCIVKNQKATDRRKDLFYDVLKDRVAAALKEKGIDPMVNRGASLGRCVQYFVIFAAWLMSGLSHVKVRLDATRLKCLREHLPCLKAMNSRF
jgi:hypothetical protein